MPEPRPLPAHVTQPLLDRVVAQAVDQEYADVAARREGPAENRRAARSVKVGVVLTVIGLLAGVAFALHARDAEVDETSRGVLIGRIEDERAALAAQQDRAGEAQADIVRLEQESAAVTERLTTAQAQRQRLGVLAGYVPTTGPGVRITVDDSPSGLPEATVRDEDLALLVDGLWGAGAEAIAINGKRLTVLSAIRNSAAAINVNSRPLSPPYVVEAIGDELTLQSRLLSSSRGNEFFGLADQLGFAYDLENVSRLRLPAARPRTLRSAVAVLPSDEPDRERSAQ